MKYNARKIKGTELYHYTLAKDGQVRPVGYCSVVMPCPRCLGRSTSPTLNCTLCEKAGTVERPPCPGHPSPEQALAHYQEYLLDRAWYKGWSEPQSNCVICEKPTNRLVTSGENFNQLYNLCDDHNNREYLIKVLKISGS